MPQELTPSDCKVHPTIDDNKFFIIGILPDSDGKPSIITNFSKENCRKMINKLNLMLNEEKNFGN